MSAPHTEPRIVAFASGKGGTGKSLLAANVGIYLATLGKRVVVVDCALGSANLHAFLGESRPHRNLAEVLGKSGVPLAEVVETTRIPGLRLVAGERDPAWIATPRSSQIARLMEQIPTLDADVVILDLAPGTGNVTLDLFLMADVSALVAIPEPTSVELCYRFIRAAFLRKLQRVGLGDAAKVAAGELRLYDGGMPTPLDVYRRAADRDEELAERVKEQLLGFAPSLVINFARSKTDMDLGLAMCAAASRRMGVAINYLGPSEYDEAVWVALRRRRPLLVEHPESRVAKCIEKVARRVLVSGPERAARAAEVAPPESHYDLLEVAPTASFEDIRRANRRVRQVYSENSVVVSGLFTPERLEGLHRRIDDAYRTLMDASKRKAYDQELFPDGVPSQAILGDMAPVARAEVALERPPMPVITDDTEFTGPLLQLIREAHGLELRAIAEHTKIGMTYLRALESEAFDKLPATVYVRGFLTEYAKLLALDIERVGPSYLARLDAGRPGEDD